MWGADRITLTRSYDSPGTISIYEGSDGGRYIIKPADRHYPGKAPALFISYESPQENTPQYLSGLFRTDRPRTYSGDAKAITGKKTLFTLRFSQDKMTASISPKEAPSRTANEHIAVIV